MGDKAAYVPDDRVFFEWEDEDGDRIMLEIEEGRAVLSVSRTRRCESVAAYLPTGERLRRLVAAIAEADAALNAPTEGPTVAEPIGATHVKLPDGTIWPHPDDPTEIEWTLRYGKPTRQQLLLAAAYVSAFRTRGLPATTAPSEVSDGRI